MLPCLRACFRAVASHCGLTPDLKVGVWPLASCFPVLRTLVMAGSSSGLHAALLGVGLWVQPLIEWVETEGLETVDDLRCFFKCQEKADAVGVLVGLAWTVCRDTKACDQSLKVVQCRLSCAEEARRMGRALARPYLPVPRRAAKPRKQPVVIDPGSDLAARLKSAAAAVQLSFSWHPNGGLAARSGKMPLKMLETWKDQCIEDIAIYEASTINQALRTWCDWEAYCTENNMSSNVPEETHLGLQIWMKGKTSASGPLAAFNTMKWLKTHLRAPVVLEEIVRPKQPSSAKASGGQKQAIVSEPGMLIELERLATQLHRAKDWRTAAVCCTHAVCAGIMRMGHLERSRFLRKVRKGFWLQSYRGKVKNDLGNRPAFDWFYPESFCPSSEDSPAQILHDIWDTWSRKNGAPLHYLTMDTSTGIKMSGQQVGAVVKTLFEPFLGIEQSALLTSYSWRRVGATMADTFQSSNDEINKLGGWTGVYGKPEARAIRKTMGYRYCGRKGELEYQTKLEHWGIFEELFMASAYPKGKTPVPSSSITWEDLALAAASPSGQVSGQFANLLTFSRTKTALMATQAASAGGAAWAYGASAELRPARFIMRPRAAITRTPEKKRKPVKLPVKQEKDNADKPGQKFIAATSGFVVHVRLTEGSPPGILCRHNTRGITMTLPHMAMENIDEAANSGTKCCGACWDLLPAHTREWIKSNEADFAPRKAGVCKVRRTVQ